MLNLGRALLLLPRRGFVTSPTILKGHSKWQNIKATKGKNDLLKSQKMNTLLKRVKTVVRQEGFDPKLNRKLADLQLEFKAAGLSLDTLNNYLIKLKVGYFLLLLRIHIKTFQNKPEQTFHFDLIGPSGSFFIIEAEGDNKNKLQSSITKTLKKVCGLVTKYIDCSPTSDWCFPICNRQSTQSIRGERSSSYTS